MSEEQLWSIPDDVESIYIHYTTEDLLKGFREEALRHREEISQLKNQLQQKENIIKEFREYTNKTQMPEGYKKMILEILDKANERNIGLESDKGVIILKQYM